MNALDLDTRTIPSGTWGNACFEEFNFTLANGDAIASTHDIVILPAGLRPYDAALWISDPGPALSTLDVGFKSVSGVNQDNPTWAFALTVATAASYARKTAITEPFTLAQKMYLRVTVRGAAQDGAFAGRIGLSYRYLGNP